MRLVLGLLASGLCFAQYDNLRTNDDGSVLYFTTRLIQSGQAQQEWGKAFRIDAGGLAVEEIRERVESGAPFIRTNYFDIERVERAGGRTATVARRDCQVIGCASMVNWVTTVDGREYPGMAMLSPNGRYLANVRSGIPRPSSGLRVWDLATGEEWTLQWDALGNLPGGHRIVSNNGLVVAHAVRGGDVVLFRRGVPEQLTFGSENTREATIDAEASAVCFTSSWPSPFDAFTRIRRVDLATRRLSTVMEGQMNFTAPSVSDDGALVLATGGDQLWIARSDGGGQRQLTREADGIRTGVLSGDGRVAYALTKGGRLLRVETATGAATELLGRTPWLAPFEHELVAGSANVIPGSGLQEAWLVTADQQILPVLAAEPDRLVVYAGPEVNQGREVRVRVVASAGAPFQARLDYLAESVERRPRQFGAAIHENWDRTVWQEDPARPGEVIHFYATGLGPLTRLPRCYHGGVIPGPETEVLYAGPAPGFIGFWQLDLRMPQTGEPVLRLFCRFEDDNDINIYMPIPFRP
jgi:hypothetical protein